MPVPRERRVMIRTTPSLTSLTISATVRLETGIAVDVEVGLAVGITAGVVQAAQAKKNAAVIHRARCTVPLKGQPKVV